MVIEPTPVQFVGGHADGTEMVVVNLNQEFFFKVSEPKIKYGEWTPTFHTEVYVLLPGTTIYIFKRLE